MKKMNDLGFYFITSREHSKDGIINDVKVAIKAGARIIQYREDVLPRKKRLWEAGEIRKLCGEKSVLFIVNNDVELAVEADADGVHLGQEDMPIADARKMLHCKIIGVSTHSLAQAVAAEKAGADYISVGPLFPSITKPERKAVGPALLKRVLEKVKIPVVAIGGIDEANLQKVLEAGAKNVAAISAVYRGGNVERNVKNFIEKISGTKKEKNLKVVSLISGGIDSPVAAALALEAGAEVVAVHFLNYPFADRREEDKVKEIVQILEKRFSRKIRLVLVPFGAVQKAIKERLGGMDREKLQCVMCRRAMLRAASEIAEKEGAAALLTGESLGQVASQTLYNLRAEHWASQIPIMRPLLGMDKVEIEKLARGFATYTVSIRPALCCTLAPKKPATKADLREIEAAEKGICAEKWQECPAKR